MTVERGPDERDAFETAALAASGIGLVIDALLPPHPTAESILRNRVLEALADVPWIFNPDRSIMDFDLVEEVKVSHGDVLLVLRFPMQGCPGQTTGFLRKINDAVREVAGVDSVRFRVR